MKQDVLIVLAMNRNNSFNEVLQALINYSIYIGSSQFLPKLHQTFFYPVLSDL